MSRVQTLRAMSARERLLHIRIGLLLATIRFALTVLPYRVVCRAIDTVSMRPDPARLRDPDFASECAAAIVRMSRYVPRATCLVQAHTLRFLMQKHGLPVDMRIGVQKHGDELSAHAWVESEGAVILGRVRGLARYNVLSR